MSEWLVIRYRFNEDWKAWVPDSTMVFKSDEELLRFLRENAGVRYRYEITRLVG
ncbi:hypothetical protein X802_08420 [Thermococcus guaymasensis DSM 11113]|uniref:Uncharacterized protein n=1 Tax=Thermococcus guaymasensis DSM 11113 TaxID=1432656 RepID=A0A0X1KND4_9EURY|nr:hypothetical protein [Thermococcus guaymasensis]AJC72794.1 hypothetical protein X802_08420 [Thermococcus guaymasensis DSM 11113]